MVDPAKIRQQVGVPGTVVHGDSTPATVMTPNDPEAKTCETCGALIGTPGHENGSCSHP